MKEMMASNAEIRINLTALKRQDPYISNIIDSSTQVAIYTFNHQTDKWEKTEVEGSLFVYSRLAPPMSGFTIMNRLSMDNFSQPLTKEIEFHKQDPFILFRNAKFAIFGIWFYDIHDSHRIGNLLEKLCNDGKSSPVPIPSSRNRGRPRLSNSNSSSSSQRSETAVEEETVVHDNIEVNGIATQAVNGSQQSVNILDILCKAKVDYDKTHGHAGEREHESNTTVAREKPTTPISIKSDLKKLNVAALFKQAESKSHEQAAKPSSAEVLKTIKSKNRQNPSDQFLRNQGRDKARSLSLSLTDEQVRAPEFRNIVNGAISVVELESPVLNVFSHDAQNSPSKGGMLKKTFTYTPGLEGHVQFDKLLGKSTNPSAPGDKSVSKLVAASSNELNSESENFLSTTTSVVTKPLTYIPPKANLQRSMSTPIGVGAQSNVRLSSTPLNAQSTSGSSLFQSTFPLTSSVPHAMPTLHEDSLPNLMLKSISTASGQPPDPVIHHTTQLSATLHGTNKQHEDKSRLSSNALKVNYAAPSKFVSLCPSTESSEATLATDPVPIVDATAPMSESKTLISPEDFEHSTATPQKAMELRKRLLPPDTAFSEHLVLSKNQLAETLITMLQTDTSFVDTVHKAYLGGLAKIHHEQDQYDTSNISISMSPLWDS